MSTLAEIIEEGKRLEAAFTNAINDGFDSTARECDSALVGFYADNGARLLAVAEAAVEMRAGIGVGNPVVIDDDFAQRAAAFDAAAGEAPR